MNLKRFQLILVLTCFLLAGGIFIYGPDRTAALVKCTSWHMKHGHMFRYEGLEVDLPMSWCPLDETLPPVLVNVSTTQRGQTSLVALRPLPEKDLVDQPSLRGIQYNDRLLVQMEGEPDTVSGCPFSCIRFLFSERGIENGQVSVVYQLKDLGIDLHAYDASHDFALEIEELLRSARTSQN